MKLTIFTPTYNRGYIIGNLYKSLKSQTVKDFEWIVIDDGSTDNTMELFESWVKCTSDFKITYLKTENGGKHRAINKGVSIAKGELFFIVDSDDYLTDDAVETIIALEATIPQNDKQYFAGVCENIGYSFDSIVGKTFSQEGFLDITTLERSKYGISGDKAEVFYTDVLRKYPFPEFEGEKFVTECVVWDRIAYDGYKLRFDNKIVYICDYLPDGLTAHYEELYEQNPAGYGLFIYQRGMFGVIYGVEKWKEYYKYYSRFKPRCGLRRVAKFLHYNPLFLLLRITGMKVFYKMYDR